MRNWTQELLTNQRASLVNTTIIAGQQAAAIQAQSVDEIVHPTSGDPAKLAEEGDRATQFNSGSFATRNVGASFQARGKEQGFALDAEWTQWVGKRLQGQEENRVEIPVFHVMQSEDEIPKGPTTILLGSFQPDESFRASRQDPIVLAFYSTPDTSPAPTAIHHSLLTTNLFIEMPMTQSKTQPPAPAAAPGRIVGLDLHPDTFTAAILEGTHALHARVCSMQDGVAIQNLSTWAQGCARAAGSSRPGGAQQPRPRCVEQMGMACVR